MKGILTIILCLILFIGIVLAILFHETVRNFRKILQKAAEAREGIPQGVLNGRRHPPLGAHL